MAKYSFEFKKEVVQSYLDNKGSYRYLANQYNISDKSQIRHWVNAYKEFGDTGLLRSRKNKIWVCQVKCVSFFIRI